MSSREQTSEQVTIEFKSETSPCWDCAVPLASDRKQFGAVKDSFAVSLHEYARLQCRIVYFNLELVLLLVVIIMTREY